MPAAYRLVRACQHLWLVASDDGLTGSSPELAIPLNPSPDPPWCWQARLRVTARARIVADAGYIVPRASDDRVVAVACLSRVPLVEQRVSSPPFLLKAETATHATFTSHQAGWPKTHLLLKLVNEVESKQTTIRKLERMLFGPPSEARPRRPREGLRLRGGLELGARHEQGGTRREVERPSQGAMNARVAGVVWCAVSLRHTKPSARVSDVSVPGAILRLIGSCTDG